MCSVIILRRPGHLWPLILGTNRDEMSGRPWRPPGRHWSDRPEVTAGHDELAGGSWLGINDHGLVACVLNRFGTLGPALGKRSRGELVLEALDHADAGEAARALSALEPSAYRSFNLLLADNRDAFWLRNAEGAERIEPFEVPEGLHMLTAHDLDDREGSARIARHLDRFHAAPPPDPEKDDWSAWEALLASRGGAEEDPGAAMTVVFQSGFRTVSSSLLALPAAPSPARPHWRFAPGRPDETPYAAVDLGSASQSLNSIHQ